MKQLTTTNFKNIQATPAAEFQKKKRVLKQAHMSGEESVLLDRFEL